MFTVIKVELDDLADGLTTFVQQGPLKNIWQAVVHVIRKSNEPVVTLEVQIDKTFKHRLTIQTIEVEPEFQRQGLCRDSVKALKKASVVVNRVAHVESVHNEHMVRLLLSEDFFPSDGGFCYEWKPLTLQSWLIDTSFHNGVDKVEFRDCVTQLTDIWKESIPGMELFAESAKWFQPETDLEKISTELGISVSTLEEYRVDKGCFAMSSLFSEKYTDYYVIEGLAIEPSFGPLALEHACVCGIKKGKIFVFDLVRRNPLFVYGVVVRMDMKRKMNQTCKDTWAGYSVINGLNYVKNMDAFW